MPLVIPEAVRRKAEVAGAVAWLVELPSLVAELEEEWAISVGPSFGDATEAFVASAVCDDGTPVVLKLMVLRAGNAAANEITVLRLADGDGCARLLRSDASRGALLLEALGPSLNDLALPIRRRLEILCDAARLVWRPAAGLRSPDRSGQGPVADRLHRGDVGLARRSVLATGRGACAGVRLAPDRGSLR